MICVVCGEPFTGIKMSNPICKGCQKDIDEGNIPHPDREIGE